MAVKDFQGRIVFTREQLVDRKQRFLSKIEDYKKRIEKAQEEVSNIDAQLASDLAPNVPQSYETNSKAEAQGITARVMSWFKG